MERAWFLQEKRELKKLKKPVDTSAGVSYFHRRSGSTKTIVTSPSSFSLGRDEGSGFFVVFGNRVERAVEYAHVAQLAERVLGKDEVISSTLIMGSRIQY